MNLEIRDLQREFEETRKKLDNDMQYVDSKLSLVDDTEVLKKWTNA